MHVDTMQVKLRKWGNSWAVRLGKKELERLGIEPTNGKALDIAVKEKPVKWDVSMIPVFRSKGPRLTFKQIREAAWKARAEELLARR